MNNSLLKKTIVLLLAALSSASLASCGMIEMRDSFAETEKAEAEATFMLKKAERKNTIETSPIPLSDPAYSLGVEYIEPEKTILRFTAAGDIRIDEAIIKDAANRAGSGNSYSFLKMYSGIYRDVRDSDLSLGKYSAVSVPFGAENAEKSTPIESIASLSELGFKVLDTGCAVKKNESFVKDMADYGIVDIDPAGAGTYVYEQDGLKVAVMSVNAENTDGLCEDIEYADFISDVVIVSLNWGNIDNAEAKEAAAYSAAVSGADIIIGSGSTLGEVEWIDTGDGTLTLAVYSLGNFIASSEDVNELCGGILSVDITSCNGMISLENTCVAPTVIHYTAENRNYQLFELSEYSDDIAASHAIEQLKVDEISEKVRSTIDKEFLPDNINK